MGNAWRDVEAWRRKLDWAVAIGDPTELDFLTPLGRQTAVRMIDDLEKFFGPGWLNKAVHPAGGVAGPTMGPYFASLAGVGAFRCVVGLWARLQFLVHTETAGIGILRRNLQANPVADEFRHHTALARLAVQAHLVGARVTLEPKKPEGGPGDLRAVRAGSDVFIELRTFPNSRQRPSLTRGRHLRPRLCRSPLLLPPSRSWLRHRPNRRCRPPSAFGAR